MGLSRSHSSGVNGLTQTVNPSSLVEHSSSAAVVEVVAGTVVGAVVGEVEVGTVVGAVVVGTVVGAVVGEVEVGTVVGAVVVGTVVGAVVGEVEVGTVVGAVVVGTVVGAVVGEVEVGTVVGAVVVGTVVGAVVGEVEVGTVVGAVVVGTVVGAVVGEVEVGTVVGAVVVGTVVGAVVGEVEVGTVVGAVVVGTVVGAVVGEVEVGTVVGAVVVGTVVGAVVGLSRSHSSGVNGLTQTVNPSSLVEHSSSATAAAANMTSPAAIRKRNADLRLRATNSFGNVHCQDSCGRTETVPAIGSGLYRARTDPASLYAPSRGSGASYLVEVAALWDESRLSMNYAAYGLTWNTGHERRRRCQGPTSIRRVEAIPQRRQPQGIG